MKNLLKILFLCFLTTVGNAQVRSNKISIGTTGLPDLFGAIDFRDDNGNKILENRESGKIILTLYNRGKGIAEGIIASVMSLTPDKNLSISGSQRKKILKPGDSVIFTFALNASKQIETKTTRFEITVLEEGNKQDLDPVYLELPTLAYDPPKLQFSGLELIEVGDDVDVKKNDGRLQPRERVWIKVVVQNVGQSTAPNAVYSVTNQFPDIKISNNVGSFGSMQPGEVKEFRFNITTPSPGRLASITGNLPLFLTVKNDEPEGELVNFQLPIMIDQKPPEQNIVQVKPKIESLKKNFATFELSNKFKMNKENLIDINSIEVSVRKRPKSIGVVIGVEEYKDLAPAPFAANDAKIMKEYFQKVLGVDQVIILTNTDVTMSKLDDIFNPKAGDLAAAITKGESDIFIFYSGHGVPDKNGSMTYLFPNDGKIANLENRAYALPKFYADLNALGARSVTVMLDACFSGAARKTEGTIAANLTGQKGIKLKINKPWETYTNFTVINSSTNDETSLGFVEAGTGLFTYFVAAGLKGEADKNKDRKITLGELRDYVTANVVETSKKKSGLQTPEFFGPDSRVLVEY